jgi:hypothetical protein
MCGSCFLEETNKYWDNSVIHENELNKLARNKDVKHG